MCGYCIEKMVIVNIAEGEPFRFLPASSLYLQEAGDLLAAVREIKRLCRVERVPSREYLDRQIIMARLLETLWREGMASPHYERLAWNAGILQVMHRKEVPEQFSDACAALPMGNFQDLCQPGIYTDREKWELFMAPDLAHDCRVLLSAYIDRWLHGAGLESYNREKELGFTHYNIPDPEWSRLLVALPVLMFSLLFLSASGEGDDLISKVMVTPPVEARPFDSPTLWLQRKAVELTYEAKGLSPFLPYDTGIRQFHIAHLAWKKNFHRFTRRRLAKSIIDVSEKFEAWDSEEIDLLLWR